MSDRIRITATVSKRTKACLDRLTRATGLKKSRVIKAALAHHLLVLDEVPASMIVPSRIVVDREVGERILKRIGHV